MSSDLKNGDIVDVTVKARVVSVDFDRVEVYYDTSPPRYPFIKEVRLARRELKIGDRVRLGGPIATWIWLGSQWMLIEAKYNEHEVGSLRPRDGITFDEKPWDWTYIPVGEVEHE